MLLCEYKNKVGLYETLEKANKDLLWTDPQSKEGVWMVMNQGFNGTHYKWVEGNFFD